ncbi:hypothetical protein Rmar_1265 [Rhodothermus marinus DSM 4252]|uniref:Uncharacterized protein n=2 Tax=Rhodothermus marinus TaxID=29549 RepID=D0MI47_RHOM4|nr:hypothetical protein Rmar_1265 [Rhodothermus marinus DSM 4252]
MKKAAMLRPLQLTPILLLLSTLSLPAPPGSAPPSSELPASIVRHRLPDPTVRFPLRFDAYHVQGLVVTDTAFFITAVDRRERRGWIFRVARASGRPTLRRELTEGERIHPGGLAFDGRLLWVPSAPYHPGGPSRILALSPDDFSVVHSFSAPRHISLLAADPEGRLVGTDWDSRHFYIWDPSGRLLAQFPSPTGVAYQDCQFVERLLLCGGYHRLFQGVLDWIDLESRRLVQRLPVGRTRQGWPLTREGLALHRDTLYLLPYDGAGDVLAFALN